MTDENNSRNTAMNLVEKEILLPYLHKIADMLKTKFLVKVFDIEEVAVNYFVELFDKYDDIVFDEKLLEEMLYEDGYFKEADLTDSKILDRHNKNIRQLWLQLNEKGLWITDTGQKKIEDTPIEESQIEPLDHVKG